MASYKQPKEEIDYSAFDAMIAKQLLRINGGEEMRQAIKSVIEQGGDEKDISNRLLGYLPTHTGTAKQLEVITAYLQTAGEG
jgi:hypothetical protein